jgi:hypothetical protein
MPRTQPSGRYALRDVAFLREKANRRSDPRHVFYRAMLTNTTYEGYFAEVGDTTVNVASHSSGPITGRMEILYARRSGWIADA